MSLTPEQVARVTPPIGSDWDIAKNRDYVASDAVGKLTEHDLTATTTGRSGVWMGYAPVAGFPVDHGAVADEAAMLALHNWASDPMVTPVYHYVAPGDSCTRTDDPGYRWTCIAGNGRLLAQWIRMPLAAAILAAASSAAWGGITGDLSAQTDLSAALGALAPLASPALTGNPTAPTQDTGNSSTRIATTAFVAAAVAGGGGGGVSVAPSGPPQGAVGEIPDDHILSGDEGTSTSGWTTYGDGTATLSASGSLLTLGGGNGISKSSHKTLTQVPATGDFIVYLDAFAGYGSGKYSYILLENGSGQEKIGIYFGYNWPTTSAISGNISVLVNGSSPSITIATGHDYSVAGATKIAIHADRDRSCVNFFVMSGGEWDFRGSLTHWAGLLESAAVSMHLGGSVATQVGIDSILIARPNIVAIGDSVVAGHTLFDPDPAYYSGTDNGESTIWKHAITHPALRNNLIVNKGIGSQTSGQILARIAEATACSPRLVLLGASSNDRGTYTQAQRTANIQDCIDAATAAGASTIVLNSIYVNASDPNQTAHNLYFREWWADYAPTLTGLDLLIDIMEPVKDGAGDIAAANAQSDGIHPNVTGYTLIGEYIGEVITSASTVVTLPDWADVWMTDGAGHYWPALTATE